MTLLLAGMVCSGYGEEVGWRGYELPRRVERGEPLWASVVLSVPWAA